MDFSGCPDDDTFGPVVQGCRGDFDFTIKFEKIFLSIIPAAVFIAISLSRVVYLSQKPTIVSGSILRALKLVRLLPRYSPVLSEEAIRRPLTGSSVSLPPLLQWILPFSP